MSRLIYVAGPYTASTRAEVAQNIAAAVNVGLEVARLGGYPLVPHSMTSDERFERVQGYQFWINATLAFENRL